VFRNALDVFWGKNGTGRFATIGTGQTVCFGKFFLVQGLHGQIQGFGRTSFESLKVFSRFFFDLFCVFKQCFSTFFHGAKIGEFCLSNAVK